MPSRSQSWTVAELLRWTTDRFRAAGIEDPRVDAEHLLAQALSCSRVELYLQHARLLNEEARAPFRELVRRRLAREPVAYISGTRGFHALDLDLAVDGRVLIPRPETEHLVDWLLEWLPPRPAPVTRVLDVGTGSGAIALALKHARGDLEVTACDRSMDALTVARANAESHGLEVMWIESDLLTRVPTPPGGWSAIAANLPYIPSADLAGLQPEVRDYEPMSALDGGADGLDLVRRLIVACAREGVMEPGARLFLELGIGQAEATRALLADQGFEEIEQRKDLGGIARVVSGARPE
ncbi:MAG: peptide chain release factor N(5)-glutamine methyltransferase [Myxococcales bacterium]|nr:peptide chain release factor N(5)-glutamine methyltransferase [Myxococcales bacterium]MCB9750366.1 peptide chain release factor N(5)-glutamine methyltransferase [Myxococcales bacterium]